MKAKNDVRVKTYIKGLDLALEGGIPRKNLVLLTGCSGSGKTTLSMQFLFSGAIKDQERGVYLTLTEPEIKLTDNIRDFSFFEEGTIKNKKVVIIDLREVDISKEKGKGKLLTNPNKVLNLLADILNQYKPKRLVIDSLSALGRRFGGDKNVIRTFIYDLGNLLLTMDCTSLLISEVPAQSLNYSDFGVEEFICDGILRFNHDTKSNYLKRTLQIVKMRGTKHSEERFLLTIEQKGIKLFHSMQDK